MLRFGQIDIIDNQLRAAAGRSGRRIHARVFLRTQWKEKPMKKMWMTLLTLAGAAWVPAILPAANAQEKPRSAALLAEQIQDLDLTDEQDAKISDIRKEYRPKLQ